MHEAESRIPMQLLLDSRVNHHQFRLWCWLDHQCRVHGGTLETNNAQIARQISWHPAATRRCLNALAKLGYLDKTTRTAPTGLNIGLVLRTVH